MGSANTAMAIFLLAFNISACIYVRRLITAFHRDQNDLPKWAKAARAAIQKLESSHKQYFLDDLIMDTVGGIVEKSFLESSLFKQGNGLGLRITERGYDLRDALELKHQKRKEASLESVIEMVLDDKEEKEEEDPSDYKTIIAKMKTKFDQYSAALEASKSDEVAEAVKAIESLETVEATESAEDAENKK